MEQSGEQLIQAIQLDVWNALHDPEVLKKCLDGCLLMERVSDHQFQAVVSAKIGPVRAKFNALIHVENLAPPDSYTLVVDVKGGVAGFGKGTADISLSSMGDTTNLTYTVKGHVGGRLAQIGSRLIVSASRKMADSFFANFAKLWAENQV